MSLLLLLPQQQAAADVVIGRAPIYIYRYPNAGIYRPAYRQIIGRRQFYFPYTPAGYTVILTSRTSADWLATAREDNRFLTSWETDRVVSVSVGIDWLASTFLTSSGVSVWDLDVIGKQFNNINWLAAVNANARLNTSWELNLTATSSMTFDWLLSVQTNASLGYAFNGDRQSSVAAPIDIIRDFAVTYSTPEDWTADRKTDQIGPVEILSSTNLDTRYLIEWTGQLLAQMTDRNPVEWLATNYGQSSQPVDWLKPVSTDGELPVEFGASVFTQTPIPIEFTGTTYMVADNRMPLDILGTVAGTTRTSYDVLHELYAVLRTATDSLGSVYANSVFTEEYLSGRVSGVSIPFDFGKWLLGKDSADISLLRDQNSALVSPVDFTKSMFGQVALPVDWSGAIQISITQDYPIEFSGYVSGTNKFNVDYLAEVRSTSKAQSEWLQLVQMAQAMNLALGVEIQSTLRALIEANMSVRSTQTAPVVWTLDFVVSSDTRTPVELLGPVVSSQSAPTDITGTTVSALRAQLEFLRTVLSDYDIEINWREQSDESDPNTAILMRGTITVEEAAPSRRLNLRITAEQNGWRIEVSNENPIWRIEIS